MRTALLAAALALGVAGPAVQTSAQETTPETAPDLTDDPAGLRPLMEALYTPEMQRQALGLAGDGAMPSLSIPGVPADAMAEMMRILQEEAAPYLPELYAAEVDGLVSVYYKYLGEAGVADLVRLYETPIGKRLLEVQEAMMMEYYEQALPRQQAILAQATEAAIARAMTEIYGIPAPK